uniref:Uncharacterized protein LOC111132187 n=1 Tax=Crassostrea virginica TaxID=6565 RepID=A0A8B8E676_CRAVI|nr:uncharacterized protein LOC111132187 [Crassostrea virginica]
MPPMTGFGKYELVFLIAGSTTTLVLTWLIVDFCLYHKARRAKREENEKLKNQRLMLHTSGHEEDVQANNHIPDPDASSEPTLKRQETFRKFVNLFNFKKSTKNKPDLKKQAEPARSKSLDEERPQEKRSLWQRTRRLTEMLSNKISNLNDEIETHSRDQNDECSSTFDWGRVRYSDRENVDSADSGHFSEDRKWSESKWRTEYFENDEPRADNFGFNDVEEEGMRRPQKKKTKKVKEEKPKRKFALLQYRYI